MLGESRPYQKSEAERYRDAHKQSSGVLADLGGESDVLVAVASSKSRKRRRSDAEERGTDARAKAKGRGGCSDSLGPTGLSDEELEEVTSYV